MSELLFNLKHDGGNHRVEIENMGDTCVIRFGASFTLRLDEENLLKLQMHLAGAVRDLCIERRDTTDLSGKKFIVAEEDFIQQGIDAREMSKKQPIGFRARVTQG
jgi:hypothetical protein